MRPSIPFMSLVPSGEAAVRRAIDRVLARGWFILGPELEAFERAFATASGAAHAVGVGTGTDAIVLALRALGIGPGNEVITTPLSAAFSALAIVMAGATPVFADVDPDRLTIDPAAIDAAITPRTAAILPVHLYGQAADMPRIMAIAARHGLAVVEDACQAHLATCEGRPVGTFGAAAAFSFYPTKNLGALGDAGAVVTNDASLAERVRRLRNGGQTNRYEHVEMGVNSRLDEIQAAILSERLTELPAWTGERRALARRYRERLAGAPVVVPREADAGHVYHLFVVRSARRAELMAHLDARGIGTLIHYPISIPRQAAFQAFAGGECPAADRAAAEVCSLPLHPRLTKAEVDVIAETIATWRPATPAGSSG
ncbi:MAG TPA: DegT/DnrJ/EryC1/StrS family aminotransferase [Vicinamibacterales bacterium]|jgi:dTDP-4-amino-4,6-dideoxygalactose transaminase|nr:DegT/DnrJ/EryC1/StrS family aminotransferase [Vicinamibacterales bacterium]